MSIVQGAQSHYRLFGPYGVYLVVKARLARKPLEVSISANGISHPMYLRLRTTDVSLFEEIIVNDEYSFNPSREPAVIVDAGANIGLTSVYFANRFPRARIFAIEPEASNFVMLTKNAARYSNIVTVQAALWKTDTMLSLSDPGSGNWGFRTGEQIEGAVRGSEVRGITVGTLMREHRLNYIDVLKVDIEGSEKEVFESCSAWIDRVGVLIVELHDRSKSGCSRSVYSATKDFPIEWTRGETTFFLRPEYHHACPTSVGSLPSSASAGSVPRALRSRIVAVQS
jgi:FkbM family methyltransferase